MSESLGWNVLSGIDYKYLQHFSRIRTCEDVIELLELLFSKKMSLFFSDCGLATGKAFCGKLSLYGDYINAAFKMISAP